MDAQARYQSAITALAEGDYAAGFADYDARWEAAGLFRPAVTDGVWIGREWRGEDLSGQRLLLHSEQGIGDAIQFARFIQPVQALAAQTVLEVCPELRGLFACLLPQTIVGSGRPDQLFDRHCSLMSLPAALGTTLATLPPPPRFHLPTSVLASWQKRILPHPVRRNVGLVWGGNPKHPHDAQRSLPFPLLAPIFQPHPELRFFSFQVGPPAAQRTGEVLDLAPHLTSFIETAAALKQMDLVITADTAVAHLAGTLGIPTWVLLPHAASWRWLRNRTDSPWYPSMRLFRQTTPGDWHSLIHSVAQALRG